MVTRREKLRENTIEEIKEIARRQLAANGSNALSLNAIAREMELTPPALYRYFASRDDLITTLIVDAFNGLADALEAAAKGVPSKTYGRRLMAVLLAYRRWALEHPVEFTLIYGTPISGYHAPEDPTTPAARRSFTVILGILAEAYRAGKLQPLPLPESLRLERGAIVGEDTSPEGSPPPEVLYLGVVGWTRLHGILMLELFNHIQPLLADTELFYQHEMRMLLKSAGLDDQS